MYYVMPIFSCSAYSVDIIVALGTKSRGLVRRTVASDHKTIAALLQAQQHNKLKQHPTEKETDRGRYRHTDRDRDGDMSEQTPRTTMPPLRNANHIYSTVALDSITSPFNDEGSSPVAKRNEEEKREEEERNGEKG